MHIIEVYDKSAECLATANLDLDPYHRAIRDTAQQMVFLGRPDWIYTGQASSMNCIWRNGSKAMSLTPSFCNVPDDQFDMRAQVCDLERQLVIAERKMDILWQYISDNDLNDIADSFAHIEV